jgi:hypothetical protein
LTSAALRLGAETDAEAQRVEDGNRVVTEGAA